MDVLKRVDAEGENDCSLENMISAGTNNIAKGTDTFKNPIMYPLHSDIKIILKKLKNSFNEHPSIASPYSCLIKIATHILTIKLFSNKKRL